MTVTTEPSRTASSSPARKSVGDVAVPGRNELGAVTLHERVVARIAAQAVTEVPDAGSASPRILGRSAQVPGIAQSRLGSAPKVSVDVDLSITSVEVTISVRWPASVPKVAAAVRARIVERLHSMTGLKVTDVRIHVSDLVTSTPAPPRVS